MVATFDWLDFFERHNVAHKRGTRGNIEIQCPFCGADDASLNMSVSLEGKGFRCWRAPRLHFGRNPVRLVQAILRCDWVQAEAIVGVKHRDAVNLEADVQRLLNNDDTDTPMRTLILPKEFKPLSEKFATAKPFFRYLRNRGYEQPERLTTRYDLRYCTLGPFKGRVIFPVHYRKQLVTWTGRTIYKNQDLRYRSLSHDIEKAKKSGLPRAIGPIAHYLLWYDDLIDCDADTLVMTEGPFDALKVRWLGQRDGIMSTCFFTSQPTQQQVSFLHELLPKFKRRVLLLDNETVVSTMSVMAELASLKILIGKLPNELKDPGEIMTRQGLIACLK